MMKKLLLINPINTFSYNNYYEPHALGVLCALTPKNFEIEIIDENVEPFTYRQADLVAITSYTSNINRAYQIAKIYRNKSVPVVLGGVHASLFPDEALAFVTAVAVGSAEKTWGDIIFDFLNGVLKPKYFGIGYANFIKPDRSFYKFKYLVNTVETSRGCNFECDFCSVPVLYNRRIYKRSLIDVIDELKTLKNQTVFFSDDNIYGSSLADKTRFKTLCNEIIINRLNLTWIGFSTINIAKDKDCLNLTALSGGKLLMIGFESEDENILKTINKKINLKYDISELRKLVRIIHSYHIGVIGGFIYGFDSDDQIRISRRRKFIKSLKPDVVSFVPLTPFPKTNLFNRLLKENRLLYINYPEDWYKYNFHNDIVKHLLLNDEDFALVRNLNNQCFYSKWSFYHSLFNSLINTRSIKTVKLICQFIVKNFNPKLEKTTLSKLLSLHK